ncbi:uncharacterized protein LOC117147421 [Drosophila mauritiana]|uniref:Uncharacterized protein LOC117147421 n=1 Tax=Drosophila mauritiana TaxID=7226 RepID=A0A6P8KMA6_DROMA|nr:uncharacterized protein LOC117147421 [Drosophila mauritiana]
MHILGLALICFWFGFAESCQKVCAHNFKPMCGHDGKCFTEAVNACQMRNINCVRIAKRKPVFKKLHLGACQRYFTICKMLPED